MKYSNELEHHLHNCTDVHNQYNFDFGHYITVVKNIFWHLDNKLNGQWVGTGPANSWKNQVL